MERDDSVHRVDQRRRCPRLAGVRACRWPQPAGHLRGADGRPRDGACPEASSALRLNARGGRISDRYAREVIEGLGRLANLDAERTDAFGPHVLRHTFGTRLVRGGVDLVTVAELMGHARLETTRLYTLPTKADRDRALDALLTDD